MLVGVLYGGIPFKLVEPSDDDRVPRGTLEIFNYQYQIVYLVELLKTRPLLTLESYFAREWDKALTGDPPAHQPLGTPRLLSRYAWLSIVNVRVGTWIAGDLVSYGR